MSKSLVRQLWTRNRTEIMSAGVADCHARGLNSIVLLRTPMIRMFVTTERHELHRNFESALGPMSIAFHPHHCDIGIEVIDGSICNRVLSWSGKQRLAKYRYHSKLRGDQPGFDYLGVENGLSWTWEYLFAGDAIQMSARLFHTVCVIQGERAAWLIYEGAEDPEYQSICYSDGDLLKADFADMYRPMSQSEVVATIEGVLA